MALVDNAWYISSVGFTAVTQWVKNTSFSAGALVRQTAPAVGSERVFVAVVGGKTVNSSEPTLTATRGAKTVDNTITWQECTGQPALNGDLTNTATWAQVKAAAPAVLGQVIKTTSGGSSVQICTTAGTMGAAEPTFSTTAGTTTGETSAVAVWTSLGPPGGFGILACPHGRVENAFAATWGQNGNLFLLADNHTQTVGTTFNFNPPSTALLPAKIISFAHGISTAPPTAPTSGAVITNSGNFSININGWGECDGLTFAGSSSSGTSANIGVIPANAGNAMRFKNCTFSLNNNSNTFIQVGGSTTGSARAEWINCTVAFNGSTNNPYINVTNAEFIWRGGTVSGSHMPPNLIAAAASGRAFYALLEGLDLSSFTGAITPFGSVMQDTGSIIVKDCKLNAGTTLYSAAPTAPAYMGAELIRSDSGNISYAFARARYEGDLTTDTTTVRTGGATDGVTPISWKLVTNGNAAYPFALCAPEIKIWNTQTSGTVTVIIYGAGASTPTNNDLNFDIVYLGDSSFSLGSLATCAPGSYLDAAANWTTDSTSSWGGSPAAKWYNTVNITPKKIGYIYIYLHMLKASTTYYIDPAPVISGNPQASTSSIGITELYRGISRARIGIGM